MPLNWRQSQLKQHLDEMLQDGNGGRAIAIGIGALVLAPLVIPVVAKASKPIAKAAIKNSLAAYKKTKNVIAEAGEVVQDMIAEVNAELKAEDIAASKVPPQNNSTISQ